MRDLPTLKVSHPVSVVALIPSAEMPSARRLHIRLARTGEEIITKFWTSADADGRLFIPQKLVFDADWIFDLDLGQVLKNKTGRNRLIPLGVAEVERSWLGERGYMRMRRPAVPQPTRTVV